jgi:hypothetical protein
MKHYENCYYIERMLVLFSVFLMNKFVKFDRRGNFESFQEKKTMTKETACRVRDISNLA